MFDSRQLVDLQAMRFNLAHTKDIREPPMDTKDRFMRIAVIGSVILVGALALAVRLHS